MKFFFDTSALIKCYIDENGSDIATSLFNKAEEIYISSITEIETLSTFKRLLTEKAISKADYQTLIDEFERDYRYFTAIGLTPEVILTARTLIDKYQLKTLDSIQLSSVLSVPEPVDAFAVSDSRLIKAGEKEGLTIIQPQ